MNTHGRQCNQARDDLGQDDGPALRRVEPRPLHGVHHLGGEALHLRLERLVVGAELDAGDEVQPQREASAASTHPWFFGFIFMNMMRGRPLQHY